MKHVEAQHVAEQRDDGPQHCLRQVDPHSAHDVAAVTRLHMQLVGHGPMARLGERFLRLFCYTTLLEDGLMHAAVYEVDGVPAGFVAYTDRSITFHRAAIRRHWLYVSWLILSSVALDPRLLTRLFKAMWLMVSRRSESVLGEDPLGEVLGIGVLPEFRSHEFVQRTGLRIGDDLVAHAAVFLQQAGIGRLRMVVEAHNKPTLLFYHYLGARFEPYEHHGDPMVQVWFDLDDDPFDPPR